MLKLEFTQRNIELLLEEPEADAAESAPRAWTPTIAHEHKNVYWAASRSALRCRWWDSRLKKWSQKQVHVEISSSMADSEKGDAIMEAAAEVQSFYASWHTLEKNMDMRKRDRGSDDGASAESTRGEPVQKALK